MSFGECINLGNSSMLEAIPITICFGPWYVSVEDHFRMGQLVSSVCGPKLGFFVGLVCFLPRAISPHFHRLWMLIWISVFLISSWHLIPIISSSSNASQNTTNSSCFLDSNELPTSGENSQKQILATKRRGDVRNSVTQTVSKASLSFSAK